MHTALFKLLCASYLTFYVHAYQLLFTYSSIDCSNIRKTWYHMSIQVTTLSHMWEHVVTCVYMCSHVIHMNRTCGFFVRVPHIYRFLLWWFIYFLLHKLHDLCVIYRVTFCHNTLLYCHDSAIQCSVNHAWRVGLFHFLM